MNSLNDLGLIERTVLASLKSLGSACNHLSLSHQQLEEALLSLKDQGIPSFDGPGKELLEEVQSSISKSAWMANEAEKLLSLWIVGAQELQVNHQHAIKASNE